MKNNVLLIVSDQLRYDCLGASNCHPVITQNIDEISRDGVFFENAYTSIPTCCPARQSFYACDRSESFGSYWNYNITYPIGGLPVEHYSFLRDFEDAGYNTTLLGRAEINKEHGPLEYGYTKHIDTWEEYAKISKNVKVSGENRDIRDGWKEVCELNETPTGVASDICINELSNVSKCKPFFMTLCFTSPHPPVRPHEKFLNMYEKAEKWGSFEETFENKPYIEYQQLMNWKIENKTWEEWEPVVRRYYAQITEIDYHIGRIIDKLKKIEKYDDTTIIITADHGDTCGGHRMFDKHYILYEDVIHVPLIIKPAKDINVKTPFHTREYTIHNVDLGPTLMEINGIKPSCEGFKGKSFADVLRGGKSRRGEAVSTFNGAQFGLYTSRCIKTDDYKYIWNPTDVDMLFDLRKDPNELHNLIANEDYQAVLESLRKRLLEVLLEEGDPFCTIGRTWACKSQLEEGRKDFVQ